MDLDTYNPDLELSTVECGHIAKRNRRTIVAWIKAGYLPATRLPGKRGHYRIRWEDLNNVLHKPAIAIEPELEEVP